MAQNVINAVLQVRTEIINAQGAAKQIQDALKNVKLDSGLTSRFDQDFKTLDKLSEKFESLYGKVKNGGANQEILKNLNKTGDQFNQVFDSLISKWNKLLQDPQALKLEIGKDADIAKLQSRLDALAQTFTNRLNPAFNSFSTAAKNVTTSDFASLEKAFSNSSISAADFNVRINQLSNSLKGNLKEALNSGDFSKLKELKPVIAETKNLASTGITALNAELEKVNSQLTEATNLYEQFKNIKDSGTTPTNFQLFDKIDVGAISTFNNGIDSLQNKITSMASKFPDATNVLNNFMTTLRQGGTGQDASKADIFSSLNNYKEYVSSIKKELSPLVDTKTLNSFSSLVNKSFFDKFISGATEAYQAVSKLQLNMQTLQKDATTFGIKGADGTVDGFKSQLNALSTSLKNNDYTTAATQITTIIENVRARIAELKTDMNSPNPGTSLTSYEEKVKQLESSVKDLSNTKAALTDVPSSLKDVEKALEILGQQSQSTGKNLAELYQYLQQKHGDAAAQKFQEIVNALKNGAGAVEDFQQKLAAANKKLTDGVQSTSNYSNQLTMLFNRFTRFTTLTGIFDILKRSIKSAYNAVKDLDEAMNSIAVVTDMTTDDLWGQIDAYTEMANATGSTIQGVYEVAQLYYQQGLSTNDVLTATTETLKLARVAGIEYADATDYKPEGYVA